MSEREVVIALNSFLKTDGIAYRLKQSRFADQFIDVLVDSKKYGHFGFEHKSFKNSKHKSLYFSSNFSVSTKDGSHQIERITDFITKGGRKGYLITEVRNGAGKPREWFAFPWWLVNKLYKKGKPGINYKLFKAKYNLNLNNIGKLLRKPV